MPQLFRTSLGLLLAGCTGDPAATSTGTECVERFWYADLDQDGLGNAVAEAYACFAPPLHVDNGLDCDDTDAAKGGTAEICGDGVDNNCDNSANQCLSTGSVTLDVPTWRTTGAITELRALGDTDGDGRIDVLVEQDDASWVLLGSRMPEPLTSVTTTRDLDEDAQAFVQASTRVVRGGQDGTGDPLSDVLVGTDDLNAAYLIEGPVDPEAPFTQSAASFVCPSRPNFGVIDAQFLGDIQGDGLSDVAVLGWDATWMFPGPFKGRYDCVDAVTRLNYQPEQILGADIDGDGLGDVLTAGAPGVQDGIYIHQGPPSTTPFPAQAETQILLPFASTPQFELSQDVDGVNRNDLVVLLPGFAAGGSLVAWRLPMDLGTYGVDDAIAVVEGTSERPLHDVSGLGDLNGDGIDELVVGTPDGSSVFVLFGPLPIKGDILSASSTALGSPFTGLGRHVLGADVDGDGVRELLVATDVDDATGSAYLFVIELVDL